MSDTQKRPSLNTFTARQLQDAPLQAPQFVIEEILPCGLVVLAAPPKIGKSWLCLSIADAVSEGRPFWNRTTSKGSVLYLALEDSEFRLQSRLRTLGSNMSSNLHLTIRGAESLGHGLLEQLSQWVEANQDAKLIVIDTIGRVKSAGKPGLNAYESDTLMFAPLQAFATKHGLCVLAVSHFSKLHSTSSDDPFERITGSTGLFGVSDAAWVLYGKRGDEQTLRITGRDTTDASYRVKLNDCFTWELLGDSEELAKQRALDEYRRSPLVRTIRSLVEVQGVWEGTASQLMDALWQNGNDGTITSLRELGRQLHAYRDPLLSIDGIYSVQGQGGRKGRAYRFTRRSIPFV